MPAKRKLIKRAQRQQITAAILELFQHWKATGDDFPLAQALGCKPWQVPVAYPDEPCPWPPGTAGYEQWPEAQALSAADKSRLVTANQINFRFGSLCGNKSDVSRGQRSAISGCEQLQQGSPYSITSSASAKSFGENWIPSALAVFRLMTNSNLVGCCTGSSPG